MGLLVSEGYLCAYLENFLKFLLRIQKKNNNKRILFRSSLLIFIVREDSLLGYEINHLIQYYPNEECGSVFFYIAET